MRASLKAYLHKVPVLEGLPDDLSSYVPAAARLADAYRTIVQAEQAHHGGDAQAATWTRLIFGPLFSELWNAAFNIRISARAVPLSMHAFRDQICKIDEDRIDRISEFAKSLPEYPVVNWLDQETVATANLLAEAYVKASAELKAVSEGSSQELIVLRHHASILERIVSDMLTLVMEGGEPTDLHLPNLHVHRTAALAQDTARITSEHALKKLAPGKE